MQKRGLKYYSLFATMLFVLPVLLQIFRVEFGLDVFSSIATYILITISFLYNYIDVKKRGSFANAFIFDNSYRLDIFSYLTAFGFFVEFISNIGVLVKSIMSSNAVAIMYLMPLLFCAIFALLSSFYFFAIGISYGTGNYDFRSFKLYHIVVLLWSISKLLTLLSQAISITQDLNGVLRHLSIMVSAFFFYYFIQEIDNDNGAMVNTVYTARMCAYCTGFYCLDRLILVIFGVVGINNSNTIFALVSLFICLFSLFFEKSVIHNSYNKE